MAKQPKPKPKLPKWKKSSVKKVDKWKKVKKSKELITTWSGRGWNAQVIQNEDGGGWACEMRRDGDRDPVYVGPWTMGRNKVDPKPLSQNAFNSWVKSASEFMMRSNMQKRRKDRQTFDITTDDGEKITVIYDIQRGEYESVGVLTAENVFSEEIARVEVDLRFSFTIEAAEDWIQSDYAPPPPPEDNSLAQPTYDEDDVWDPDAEESEEEEFVEELEYVSEESFSSGGYEEPVFEYD